MTVTPTEGLTTDPGNANGIFAPANAAAVNLSQTQSDGQMFLQLMVAQMKYQDPMNPVDSTQMLTQQAQFTQLQSIQEIQSEMEMMLSANLAQGATSLIGKNVAWTDSDGNQQTGVVDGTTFTASGPTLSIGGQDIAYLDVTTVNPSADSGSGSSGSTSTSAGSTSTSTGSTSSSSGTTTT
jgi:flagellar basal-body rod modification protein FlgD